MKKSILLIIALNLINLVSADTGDEFGSCMMGNWMGMGAFGWIFGILVVVVLVLLIAWLIKQIQKK